MKTARSLLYDRKFRPSSDPSPTRSSGILVVQPSTLVRSRRLRLVFVGPGVKVNVSTGPLPSPDCRVSSVQWGWSVVRDGERGSWTTYFVVVPSLVRRWTAGGLGEAVVLRFGDYFCSDSFSEKDGRCTVRKHSTPLGSRQEVLVVGRAGSESLARKIRH